MDWIQIIVLAIVQGLTEFIPISSTAHLRIVPALFGWPDPGAPFSAVIQIGTLVAVLWYFWRDVLRVFAAMIADLRHGRLATTNDARLGWMIAAGTLPIIVCGLAFKDYIETTLRSLWVMSAALAVVALMLALAEWIIHHRRQPLASRVVPDPGYREAVELPSNNNASSMNGRDIDQVGWREAIVVGFAQAAALVPGTSRSGATILGGLCCGLTREAAARFSFLLSIPAILAAGVFQLIDAREELLSSRSDAAKLIVALLVTAIVGYATIPWLLGYLRRHTMLVFIVYRLLLAALLFWLISSGRIVAG